MKDTILKQITSYSIKSYRIIYLAMALTAIWALNVYSTLPRESKPEVVFATMKVNVNYPGASPLDIESLITNKIEAVLFTVPDVEFITSTSTAGRSEIQLEFYPESDPKTNFENVTQAIDSIRDLPEEAEEPTIRVSTTANRAFMVISISGEVQSSEMRDRISILESRLAAIEGIQDIRLGGMKQDEILIQYSPARLAEFGLTADDIVQTIKSRHKDTPAGSTELDGAQYYVRVLGAYTSVEEIAQTQVPLQGGGIAFLKDLARIELQGKPVSSISRRAIGLGTSDIKMMPAVTVSLYRDGGTDTVMPSIKTKELLQTLKDEGVFNELDVEIIQDDAVTVQQDLADVLGNAFSGLLIVVLVLYLFLGLREALITSLIIPFSMFLSFIALNFLGMTFNTMTLLAMIIALGLLVDNAIVVVESIADFRSKGLSRLQAAKEGTAEVASSIFSATLTTMAAFLPLSLMEGRVGMIISVIPITVLLIIGASLVIALTITPAMASRWLSKNNSNNKNSFSKRNELLTAIVVSLLFGFAFWTDGRPGLLSFIMTVIMGLFMTFRYWARLKNLNPFSAAANGYKRMLRYLLDHRLLKILLPSSLIVALGLITLGMSAGILKIELFPIKDETALYAIITTPEYSTLYNTDRIVRKAEEKLKNIDGIKSLYSEVGLTSARDAQIVMNLNPSRSWTTQEKIPELMKQLAGIPGARITIGTQAGGKTVNSPVQIKIFGEDLDSLHTVSEQVTETLSTIEGIRGITSDWESGYPEVHILPNDKYLSRSGSNVSSVGSAVQTFLGDRIAGTFLHSGEELDIVLRTEQPLRDSLDDIDNILIRGKGGDFVPISYSSVQIATQGYGTIRHTQGKRTITVMAQMLPDANIREIVSATDELIHSSVTFPKDISYEWGGEAADLDSSFSSMTFNFLAALLVVYLILSIQFNSLSQPLVIMITVPMSIIGVFIGLTATGNNFGLYAFMGVIALVGIVVNDAIVLIDTVRRLLHSGYNLVEALGEAGKSRFGPVLATSLTTIGGMLPLAFKDQNFAQLSISLISGLTASTILTLVILPMIYLLMVQFKNRFQRAIPVFIDEGENK